MEREPLYHGQAHANFLEGGPASNQPPESGRDCEGCRRRGKIDGERFCSGCRAKLLKKMAKEGYLEDVPKTPDRRPPVQENGFGELSLEELPDGGRVVGRW